MSGNSPRGSGSNPAAGLKEQSPSTSPGHSPRRSLHYPMRDPHQPRHSADNLAIRPELREAAKLEAGEDGNKRRYSYRMKRPSVKLATAKKETGFFDPRSPGPRTPVAVPVISTVQAHESNAQQRRTSIAKSQAWHNHKTERRRSSQEEPLPA